MRLAIASEGRIDYVVLKNLLRGFFKDKSLPVTLLRPEADEPFGWGNLLAYISSEDFRDDCNDGNIDCTIIQIDTDKYDEWGKGLKRSDDVDKVGVFIDEVVDFLINKIGSDYYELNKHKILFAICVHELECWLLPFNATVAAHYSKIVRCTNTLEEIALKRGFSLHKKNYEGGKNYDGLSKEMMNNKALLQKAGLNPSLGVFIESLMPLLPVVEAEQ